MRTFIPLVVTLFLVLGAGPVRAQQLLVGAGISLGTGLERSELLKGKAARRARSRISLDVDLRNDEDPKQGLGITGFAELEPQGSFGGSVSYLRFLSPNVVGFGGITGVIAPQTLLGAQVGMDLRIPFRPGGRSQFFVQPLFAVLPLGGDLPADHVLLWLILSAGFHADL